MTRPAAVPVVPNPVAPVPAERASRALARRFALIAAHGGRASRHVAGAGRIRHMPTSSSAVFVSGRGVAGLPRELVGPSC